MNNHRIISYIKQQRSFRWTAADQELTQVLVCLADGDWRQLNFKEASYC